MSMYVTGDILNDIETRFGTPEIGHFRHAMVKPEFELLEKSMKYNRAHDVTMFIFKGPGLVAIRKHMHPDGVCRAPSGGLRVGEDFEQGTLREAYEETGALIELKRYVLRAHATFTYLDKEVEWTSHVLTAQYVSGKLRPIDTKEIAEVLEVSIEDLQGRIRDNLLATGSGGLEYRVALTDKVVEILRRDGDYP